MNEKIQFYCYLDGLYESVMLLSSSHLLYFKKKTIVTYNPNQAITQWSNVEIYTHHIFL